MRHKLNIRKEMKLSNSWNNLEVLRTIFSDISKSNFENCSLYILRHTIKITPSSTTSGSIRVAVSESYCTGRINASFHFAPTTLPTTDKSISCVHYCPKQSRYLLLPPIPLINDKSLDYMVARLYHREHVPVTSTVPATYDSLNLIDECFPLREQFLALHTLLTIHKSLHCAFEYPHRSEHV